MKHNVKFNKEVDFDKYLDCARVHYPILSYSSYISHGNRGVCLLLDSNNVIKVTCDISEAVTAINIMKNPNAYMPKYYDVTVDGDYAVIKIERCEPLLSDEFILIHNFLESVLTISEDKGVSELELIKSKDKIFDDFRDEKLVVELEELVINLSDCLDLKNFDLTANNVMRLRNKLVLIDQHETHIDDSVMKSEIKYIDEYRSNRCI
ncbi:hypothetical protein D051_0880 [Vibrio parahaemolyticus VPCR-2010]|nr:hypothetical protein D051_0880 [Vibrio parahaemolyticus VPCR-2010]